jgi:hypothetical protein
LAVNLNGALAFLSPCPIAGLVPVARKQTWPQVRVEPEALIDGYSITSSASSIGDTSSDGRTLILLNGMPLRSKRLDSVDYPVICSSAPISATMTANPLGFDACLFQSKSRLGRAEPRFAA